MKRNTRTYRLFLCLLIVILLSVCLVRLQILSQRKKDLFETYSILSIKDIHTPTCMLYFHKEGCSGCLKSDEVIERYYSSRKKLPVLIYVVDPSSPLNEEIDEVPTLILYRNYEKAEVIIGAADITAYLEKLISLTERSWTYPIHRPK